MGFSINGCEGKNFEYGEDGNSSTRRFLCTPRGQPSTNKVEIRYRVDDDDEQVIDNFSIEFRENLLTNCEATFSSTSQKLVIPYIIFVSDQLYLAFSAEFNYVDGGKFGLGRYNSNEVDPLDFIGCDPAIMDHNYNIYIPKMIYDNKPFFGFLKYLGNQDWKALFDARGGFIHE